ncbi:zinc-binding dehydrogenase [Streptomyces sp. BH105]|uniref:zinc-binding dehydrogenase n=1 Tax=Streptomyces sp. BH105 TaxID=3410408 RepID=UPI003CF71972
MKALRYHRFGGPVAVETVPDPQVPDDGAVVRVAASGLCRSDWHAWAGHDDTVTLPQIPGHEFVGRVEAVGANVRDWSVGDRVTAPFVNGCGTCEWCKDGNAQVCPDQTQPGFTHQGSHAELVAVRAADTNLVAVPPSVSDAAAASLGCRFATAYRAVSARGRVRAGEWVAVFGAGGVGLSAIMIAVALGARPIAIDRSAEALELAAKAGAEHVLNVSDSTVSEIVELTGGGAHVAVDAVGASEVIDTSIRSLRRRGRHVQIGLLAGPPPAVPLDRVLAWELDVLGSHGMAASHYPELLDLVERAVLRPADLVTRAVGMGEGAQLLFAEDAAARGSGITVLCPQGEHDGPTPSHHV